jgi:hypothetical protein
MSTVARVPGYSEKPVTQKRSGHACLVIEILASIQNSSFIDCELLMCGANGSPGMVGQANDGGGDAPYGVYPC